MWYRDLVNFSTIEVALCSLCHAATLEDLYQKHHVLYTFVSSVIIFNTFLSVMEEAKNDVFRKWDDGRVTVTKNGRTIVCDGELKAFVLSLIDDGQMKPVECFTVEARYRGIRRDQFHIEEVGRLYDWWPVNIETWSKHSGDPIPAALTVPMVKVPSTLPLSLSMKKWAETAGLIYPGCNNFKVRNKTAIMGRSRELRAMLAWSARENFSFSNIDFIMSCANLRRVSVTPIKRTEPWAMKLYVHNGVIVTDSDNFAQERLVVDPFLVEDDELEMNEDPKWIELSTQELRMLNYFKYCKKFEDVMKSGGVGDEDYAGEDVDVRGVRVVTVGKHRLLTSTRISCQEPDGELDTLGNYVEIKTVNPLKEWNRRWFDRYKSLQLWSHCALIGTEAVYCGHRNADGELLEIRRYTMDELAEFGRGYWYPGEMPSFLNTLLDWVVERVQEGRTYTLFNQGHGVVRLRRRDHPDLRLKVEEGMCPDNKRVSSSRDLNWRSNT